MLVASPPPFATALCAGAGASADWLAELGGIAFVEVGSSGLWTIPIVTRSPIAVTIPAPMKRSVF
jgi:hypothetical protein